MRELLARCFQRQEAGETLWYTGLLQGFGGSDSTNQELALLHDVQVEAQLIDDHLWIHQAAPLLYIAHGTWITFQATVYYYIREKNGSGDYGLRKPHHIVPLRHQHKRVG